MKYEPSITITKRDGKVALWINMPNGYKYNIWDLEDKECSTNTINAIASAFERGMLAKEYLITDTMRNSYPTFPKVETE